jgi:hypothetical protein
MAIARSKLFCDETDVTIQVFNKTIRRSFQQRVDSRTGKDVSQRNGITEKRSEKTQELELNIRKLEATMTETTWIAPRFRTPLDGPVEGAQSFLNMDLEEYLELPDRTGILHRPDKKGEIPAELDSILIRLELDTEAWLNTENTSTTGSTTSLASWRPSEMPLWRQETVGLQG